MREIVRSAHRVLRRLAHRGGAAAATLCAAALASCSEPTAAPPVPVDADAIRTHLATLTAAEGQGAGAGDRGEALATKYVADTFRSAQLTTSLQRIPFVKIKSKPVALTVSGGGWTRAPAFGTDFVAWTRQPREAISVDAPIVFAGFGIVAPEFKWNDYKDLDVAGKVVLVLDSDPHNGDRDEFGTLGEIWYSQSSYKFHEAARHGAAAVFLIHDPQQAGSDWDEIRESMGGETLAIDAVDRGGPPIAPVEGWLTAAAAAQLFQAAGIDFDQQNAHAHETNFKPVAFDARASIAIASALTSITSTNVLGVIKGQTSEYVIVSSRWNRISAIATPAGVADASADDDGSGAATLLETARALARGPAPRRSVVFLITTAEREGLVGLEYYAEHPVFPADKTIAQVFVDGADLYSESRHLRTIGPAFSGLSDIVRQVGSPQGRRLDVEHDSDRLFYFKGSQAAFSEHAIPEIYVTMAAMPLPAGQAPPASRTPRVFNATGAIRNVDLLFNLISTVAGATNWPVLRKPGSGATSR